QDQLERLGDALLGRAAADVQEVGRFATMQLDHVHGRHGKTGAVDHAADVAVQGDVVEVVLGRLDLGLVFLAGVAHGGQLRLTAHVDSVLVNVDLGVQRQQLAIAGDDQRVDLDQRQVLIDEDLVQGLHDLDQLPDRSEERRVGK